MHNRKTALIALTLVQLFYGLTFTFANDVIVGGHIKPFGFILIRVVCSGMLFWLFGLVTPTKKIDSKDFSDEIEAAPRLIDLNLFFISNIRFIHSGFESHPISIFLMP